MEAREFSTSKAYAKGDLVLKDGKLYRFTSAHSAGAWNSAQVEAVDSGTAELTAYVSGYYRAAWAAAYGARTSFTPSQVSGTRYKYTFLTA